MTAHGARAVERCRLLADTPFSETPGSLFRFWLGPAYRRTLEQVSQWMEEAGLTTRLDAAGSLVGRYEGLVPGAPALMIGSHLDTVRNGGAFDGNLGVMLGIELVSALHEKGTRLPFAIEVMGFGDEEGSRFAAPMICSRAMAGLIDAIPEDMTDASGMSMGEAMGDYGLDPARLAEAARRPDELLAYIEPHIEQGPALESTDGQIGVVTAIAAQTRQRVTVTGQSDHAGTTPMTLRQDALTAVAEMILAVERHGAAGGDTQVATVGHVEVLPNTSNVIPGEVRFSLDMRAATDAARDVMVDAIRTDLRFIAARRGVGITFDTPQILPAAACAPELVERLARAATGVTGRPAQRLLSGAGHDAMAMVDLCPMGMLFIRSPGGLSHHPDETVRVEDVDLAHRALLAFVKEFQS
ncbi:allantoate amidohydrolase [Gluconobacter kanchanaburiensis]|uniref:Zn-dependent hydrolase n=1 Tax=Gluconobacter kanchanaburiensis NBRC 103587 TaxID=1307948 RepID=A0A511B9F8_9PROT|nr:allantoate amidohydrolase [Gluconobacter kanchanaburiensis]MBF0862372.1 allantoate amidohydrolase [Gluconobacter kanchanaburiensis]GBR68779.1 allantoate amidohydrolase [Gluconobacter kanchanaburiensis NBRC 103587]GEK96361.1 Zn-dependent hydrolase [Gluconobacter kanchanaburiensis NBRC 103587]